LDSPLVTPAGYLLLLRMSDTIQIAARMPFRVAEWSGNIFFGFNVLLGVHGERAVCRSFQGTERTEKWQTFSVTVTKSVNSNRSGYVPLVEKNL
jgi:hypothetical protein